MDHPESLTDGPLAFSGSNDQIIELTEQFRALSRRRLVILGGPGTGKTTLAVLLVLRLLASRQKDEPVPVLVSLAGWDTRIHSRLSDWLVVRLEQDYPALRATDLGEGAARILVARGHILAVLDGLDELPGPARATAITALNRSLSDSDQFILTSRTSEFVEAVQDAADVLTSAAVITPLPLFPEVAANYLYRCLPPRPGPSWEQVLTVLRTSAPSSVAAVLTEITSTPLGLWLLRTAYLVPDADPAPLLDLTQFPTAAVLRDHLFDRLIPALVKTRLPSDDPAEPFRPRRVWDSTQVCQWLANLAHYLNHMPTANGQTGTRDFAWWQLARDTLHPRTLPLVARLAGGLMARLKGGSRAVSWPDESPGFADLRTTGRLLLLARLIMRNIIRTGPVVGMVTGLATALVTTLIGGLGLGMAVGVAVGLLSGFVSGLQAGLVEWAETPTSADRASTPMTNWRADRALNLTRITAGGLASGLVTGLMYGLVDVLVDQVGLGIGPAVGLGIGIGLALGLGVGLAVGLVFGLGLGVGAAIGLGLVGGLVNGLAMGRHHAWVAYVAATYRLAWNRQLPRRLMPFLDDAHRLGLLRAVGPIYQFRHAELQDYLADKHSKLSQVEIESKRIGRFKAVTSAD